MTVPTVPIPAPIYDATLAWCNERRAEKGMEPIEALPAGRPGNGTSCPCGAVTGCHVGSETFTKTADEWSPGAGEDLPEPVIEFVALFDKCMGVFDYLPLRTEGSAA